MPDSSSVLLRALGLVTLSFVMACLMAVVLGKGIAADVLVLPVATLFAFTQLRGTLPGAPPGFGTSYHLSPLAYRVLTTCVSIQVQTLVRLCTRMTV